MHSADSDDQLMKKLARGDHSALVALLDRHGSSVYGYCMRLFGGNRANVDDATQEVWLRVARNAASYHAGGTFKAWLMTITRNCAVSLVRKEHASLFRDDPEAAEAVESGLDLEKELLRRYDLAGIRAAVNGLSPSQRAVFVLWLEEDASYETIGERLGLAQMSVRSMLARAKENLKKKLGGR